MPDTEYKILTDLDNISLSKESKIDILHNFCNNAFTLTARSILENSKCPYCFVNGKPKGKLLEKILSEKYDQYSILSSFTKDGSQFLNLKCNVCNYEFEHSVLFFKKSKPLCPNCERKFNLNIFKKKVFNLVGDEYTVIGTTEYSNLPIEMIHNKCGRHVFIRPNNFLNAGNRCKQCSKLAKTNEEFDKKIIEIFGSGRFERLSDYVNTRTKIKIKDNLKQQIRYALPNAIYNYNPSVNSQSKGEHIISEYLSNNNYIFTPEKRYTDLKDKSQLRYDFFIEKYNLLIEFDGEQHYFPIFGDEKFEITIFHDKLKQEYAIKNNISLLRIPYYQINKIESILNNTFKKFNKNNKYKIISDLPTILLDS